MVRDISRPIYNVFKERKTLNIVGISLFIFFVLSWLWYEIFTWPYRKTLPFFVYDVKECSNTEFLLPDFSYYLRAEMSKKAFEKYVARLHLTPQGSQFWLQPIGVPSCSQIDWWIAADEERETYGKYSQDGAVKATYVHGFIYVYAYEN